MSQDDIDAAIREAELHAEEDKKAKEAIEVKNNAENLIFQSEKTLGELNGKLSDAETADVRAAIDKLKETVKTDDTAAIKADTEALEKAFYAVSEKLYQQQGAAGADAGNAGNAGGDGTYYDANYEDNSNNSGN